MRGDITGGSSPAGELLRAAAGVGPVGADVEGQAATVHREGLEGLLHARRASGGVAPWQAPHRLAAADNLRRLHTLRVVLARLPAHAQPLILPGASLLPLYPDIGCRPMDDVDVLAPPGRRQALREGLLDAGMTCGERHPDLLQLGELTVDVHDDLINGDRIRARRLAGGLTGAEVWNSRRPLDLGIGPTTALGLEEEVLYTAAHALRHSYRRLTWLVDLHLQLRQDLDWGRLRQLARDSGMARALLYGMWQLRDGGLPLPPPADRWLAQARLRPSTGWLLRRILSARSRTCGGEILWCASGACGVDRIRLLAEFAFPRTDVMLQVFPRLPRRLAALAYPLRCGQLAVRAVTELAAATRGWGVRA